MRHGARNWSVIAHGIRGRSGKSCRLRCVSLGGCASPWCGLADCSTRWCNQLNPAVKKEPFTREEDAKILQARVPSERPPCFYSHVFLGPQRTRKQMGHHRAPAGGAVRPLGLGNGAKRPVFRFV